MDGGGGGCRVSRVRYETLTYSLVPRLLCEMEQKINTVDRENFTLKTIRVKNFRVNKFSQFRSIREILTVNGYNMDEHLESS